MTTSSITPSDFPVTLQFVSSLSAVPRETGAELGGALLGEPSTGALPVWPVQRIFAPLLGATSPVVQENWLTTLPLRSGGSDDIVWCRNDGVLYGVLELSEADFLPMPGCSSLQAASAEAYRRIFRLLDAQAMPHLWRVWNYLADINLETEGLERYRQFNIGRQDAFVACRRGASGNVPAACAIGLVGGTLNIAFMAGTTPAVPVENPRQVSAYNYPADYGPRSPTFSRAALVYPEGQEILFISGTASIVGHQTVHPGDVVGQCRESMANIAAVLAEANRLRRSPAFMLSELCYRVYVRHAGDFDKVRAALRTLIGAAEVVYVQADICRHDLLLEIEAFASHALEN
jgi:chorismate lyase/3-hydroxybenzoate synthase